MTLQLSRLERIEYAPRTCKHCGLLSPVIRNATCVYVNCDCTWLRVHEHLPFLRRNWVHNGVGYRQTWPGLQITAPIQELRRTISPGCI